MSFDFDIPTVLQYAYNIFGSLQGIIYLFLGAAFAIFVFVKILEAVRNRG